MRMLAFVLCLLLALALAGASALVSWGLFRFCSTRGC